MSPMCASDSYNCRGSKSRWMSFMESKGEADWIIGKKKYKVQEGGPGNIRDREREGERYTVV